MQVTEAEFELFKAEFTKWREAYGCLGWEVVFVLKDLDDVDAKIQPEIEGKVVIVSLGTDISRNGETGVKFLAFHEATELFLTMVRSIALNRCLCEDQLTSEIHQIINVLSRLLFKE